MNFIKFFVLLMFFVSSFSLQATEQVKIENPSEPKDNAEKSGGDKSENAPKTKIKQGKVIEVLNSVSFKVKDSKGKEHILRLSEINTPYMDKPHGPESLKALKDLISDKEVSYEVLATEQNGKKIVKASYDGKNINAFMIENGHAWMSQKYGRDPQLLELQEKAKSERKGIWANQRRAGHGSRSMKKIHASSH